MDEAALIWLVLGWIVVAIFAGGTFSTWYVMGGSEHSRVPFRSYVLGTLGAPITIMLAIIKGLFGHDTAQRSLGFLGSRATTAKHFAGQLDRKLFDESLSTAERQKIRQFEKEGVSLLGSLEPLLYINIITTNEDETEETAEQKQWRKEIDELRLAREHIAAHTDTQELGQTLAETDARISALQEKLIDKPKPASRKVSLHLLGTATCDEAIARQPDNPYFVAVKADRFCSSYVINDARRFMRRYPYPLLIAGREKCSFWGRKTGWEAWIEDHIGLYYIRRAITLDPTYIAPHVQLAEIYNERGQSRKAIKWANAALAIDAKYEDTYYGLGPINNSPTQHVKAYYELGHAHQSLGNYEEARNAYTGVLEASTSYLTGPALTKRAEVLKELGSHELVLADLKRKVAAGDAIFPDYNLLIELEPNNLEHYVGRTYVDGDKRRRIADTLQAAKLYRGRKTTLTDEQRQALFNILWLPLRNEKFRDRMNQKDFFALLPVVIEVAKDANNPIQRFPEVLSTCFKFAVENGQHKKVIRWAENCVPLLPQANRNRVDHDIIQIHDLLASLYASPQLSCFDLSKAREHAEKSCNYSSIYPEISSCIVLWAIAEMGEAGSGKEAIAVYDLLNADYEKVAQRGRIELERLRLVSED